MEEIVNNYLNELKSIAKKLNYYKSGEIRNRLIRDYKAIIYILTELEVVDENNKKMSAYEAHKDEIKKYYAPKADFRSYSRFVLNNQKMYESHDDVYKLIKELIETVGDSDYHDDYLTKVNVKETKKIVEDFFKWVGDDCYNFYLELQRSGHILKHSGSAFHSFCIQCSKPIVMFGSDDQSIRHLSYFVHEFGHAYYEHIGRNNSFISESSQYGEFPSIFFQQLFDIYLDEKKLFVEDRKRFNRYELYMRKSELKDSILVEELLEKGYIKRYRTHLEPNVPLDELDDIIKMDVIPYRKDYVKLKKKEEETSKEFNETEQELYNDLLELFKDCDYSKLEYECDNKEEIVKLRIRRIVELMKENDYENVINIFSSLIQLKNTKKNIFKLTDRFVKEYLNVDYLNILKERVFGKKEKLSQDEIFKFINDSFIKKVVKENENIEDILDILFDNNDIEDCSMLITNFMNTGKYASKRVRRVLFNSYVSEYIKQSIEEKSELKDGILSNLYDFYYNETKDIDSRFNMLFIFIKNIDEIKNAYIESYPEDTMENFEEFSDNLIKNILESNPEMFDVLLNTYINDVFDIIKDNKQALNETLGFIIYDKVNELDIKEEDLLDAYYLNLNKLVLSYFDFSRSILKAHDDVNYINHFTKELVDYLHNMYINILNNDADNFAVVVDKLLEYVYGENKDKQKKFILNKYVKEQYKGNQSDFGNVIDGLKKALVFNDNKLAEVLLKEVLKLFTDNEQLIDNIIINCGIILEEQDKKEKDKFHDSIIKLLRDNGLELKLGYQQHRYVIGRVFASYFANLVRENKEEGLKLAYEFMQNCDYYSVSEALDKYPTAVYHAKKDIIKGLTPEYSYENGTRRKFIESDDKVGTYVDKIRFSEFKEYVDSLKNDEEFASLVPIDSPELNQNLEKTYKEYRKVK